MVNENGANIASTLQNMKITSNQNALTAQKDQLEATTENEYHAMEGLYMTALTVISEENVAQTKYVQSEPDMSFQEAGSQRVLKE